MGIKMILKTLLLGDFTFVLGGQTKSVVLFYVSGQNSEKQCIILSGAPIFIDHIALIIVKQN